MFAVNWGWPSDLLEAAGRHLHWLELPDRKRVNVELLMTFSGR